MRCPHCGYNSFADLHWCKKCGGELEPAVELVSTAAAVSSPQVKYEHSCFTDEAILPSIQSQPGSARAPEPETLEDESCAIDPDLHADFSPQSFSWVAPNQGIPQVPGADTEAEVEVYAGPGGSSGVPVPSAYTDEDAEYLRNYRLRRTLFFARRFLATGVDGAVVVLLWLCFYTVCHTLLWNGQQPFFAPAFEQVPVRIGLYLQAVLITLAYFTLFHYFNGQTPGKMLTRIKVVPCVGENLTLTQVLLRISGGLMSVLCGGIGYVAALFSAEGRGWNDVFAGSMVVDSAAAGDAREHEPRTDVSTALLED